MDGIHADKKLGLRQNPADNGNIVDGVMVFDCVQIALPLCFSDILHIDKNTINTVLLCDERNIRAVCDVHQF